MPIYLLKKLQINEGTEFCLLNYERGSEVGSVPEDSNSKKMHGLGGPGIK